jgi:hypothetical protein
MMNKEDADNGDNGNGNLDMSRSSISSIKSLKEPLEDMSRDRIIQHYHNHKNRINLSNIVGLSEALAREGFSNSQSKPMRNTYSLSQQNRQSYNSHTNLKLITAKSMYLPE